MARIMSRAEEQYIMHAIGGDPLIANYIDNQVLHGNDFMQTAANLLVCGRCESLALAHGKGYVCPKCGHRSETRNTHTMKQHLKRGVFR